MIRKLARYLIRFDDLCPTMSRAGWDRFELVIQEFNIRPILAVVPENQDPDLMLDAPDPEFWERMRKLEAAGATTALHGYRHLCVAQGRSLLGLHRHTEFAGVSEREQEEWIREGLRILRGHGLTPKLWVAPRHGFDDVTLRVLSRAEILYISDGFARAPVYRDGVTWIPQQLWKPVTKPTGLWTICIHSNTAPDSLVHQLRAFLRERVNQITCFDRIAQESGSGEIRWPDRLYEACAIRRVQALRTMKALARKLYSA